MVAEPSASAEHTPSPRNGEAAAGGGGEAHSRYLNRELSWLAFNQRVLERAQDDTLPLLERVRFLAIAARNLDEFVMVRVAGLQRRHETGIGGRDISGMSTREQLREIRAGIAAQRQGGDACWTELRPQLSDAGVEIVSWEECSAAEQERLQQYFSELVHPILTPLAIDAAHPFPYITGLSLNLGVVCQAEGVKRYARVKIPHNLPQLIAVGGEPERREDQRPKRGRKRTKKPAPSTRLGSQQITARVGGVRLITLEELLSAHLSALLPGVEILGAHLFRVTRNAEVEVAEDRDENLLQALERELRERRRGAVVRLEVRSGIDEELVELLVRELEVEEVDCHAPDALFGDTLEALAGVEAPALSLEPHVPRGFEGSVMERVREADLLVHHPYDSFATSVQRFLEEAAADPEVLAVKQTLYRAGEHSPVVEALIRAAESGKQVVAVVELTARFDEQANIRWARELERAGVHVVYGTPGLKTHAKVTLVSRAEAGRIRQYCHVGTGNYHPRTARGYEDLGLLTCDPRVAADLTTLFNSLTGYWGERQYSETLVAPLGLRAGILSQISEAAARRGRGEASKITMKLNNLVDEEIIEALYQASQAGVEVECVIRSICALRPGVPGVSETIKVRSVLGRFLEHSRLMRFEGAGEDEWWMGSPDLMHRNLDRRVETLVRVRDARVRERLAHILDTLTRGDVTHWVLEGSGGWKRMRGAHDVQELLDERR